MYAQLRRRLDHKDDAGFTLIELLMVIVILAVLAAVVVFSVGGINNSSKASACKAELTTVNTAGEAYYAQKGSSAPDLSTLISSGVLHDDADIDAAGSTGVTQFTSNGYTFKWTPGTAGSTTNAAGNLAVTANGTTAATIC